MINQTMSLDGGRIDDAHFMVCYNECLTVYMTFRFALRWNFM